MRDISDHSVDLILCDLPYGCLTSGQPDGLCSWDVKLDLEAFWKEVKRIRRDDHSPCIQFCSTKFGADLITSNPKEFRYDMVWAKTNAVGFLSANKKPMAAHELMYVFSKKGAYYKRKDLIGDYPKNIGGISTATFIPIAGMSKTITDNTGRRCVTSVITVANKKRKGGHPTEKPVELYRWLLERYCPAGGTVLDPTFGSGNSVFTARDMGFHAIGIEKDPVFFKKANDKIESD